jgi:hypothetical protein
MAGPGVRIMVMQTGGQNVQGKNQGHTGQRKAQPPRRFSRKTGQRHIHDSGDKLRFGILPGWTNRSENGLRQAL